MSLEVHKHIHRKPKNAQMFAVLHKKRVVKVVDACVLVVGIVTPFTTLPQIFEIIKNKSAENISTITWVTWIFFSAFWLVYGIAHREKALIINNIFWIIFDSIIIALSLIY